MADVGGGVVGVTGVGWIGGVAKVDGGVVKVVAGVGGVKV